MAIEIRTTEYQMSHGQNPRGRGAWAFYFDKKNGPGCEWWAPGSMTYTEALKLAKAEAKQRGAWLIEVGS